MEREPIVIDVFSRYLSCEYPEYLDLKYNLPIAIRYLFFDDVLAFTVQKGNKYFNAVVIVIVYAVSVFLIVFEALNLNKCPVEKKLPLFLMVLGIILLVERLCNYQYDFKNVFFNDYYDDCEYDVPATLACLNLIFLLSEFAALITLCVYAFSTQPTTKLEDHNLPNYCDSALYLSGYWVSVSGLIFYCLRLIRFWCQGLCKTWYAGAIYEGTVSYDQIITSFTLN